MNKKRALAAILWFFAVWTAGSFVAFALALPNVGPILGLIAGALITFGSDRLWETPAERRSEPQLTRPELAQASGTHA